MTGTGKANNIMLLNGIDHVATITGDTDRLHRFYAEMFGATVEHDGPERAGGPRLSIIKIGPHTELNVFEIEDNNQAEHQTPMFGRGRIDHLGLQAPDIDSFDEIRNRLMNAGATDGFVTDFGWKLSLFFRDPDLMECEVLVANPDAKPGQVNPPGTPAARYQTDPPIGQS